LLSITGRLKEIINRGGEKISPREVDEILLAHPGVSQAVTFGMPDQALGEDVAAAVVVNDPAVTEKALRQYAAQRLAYFKVPRRIVLLEEIPKGATGKLQRIGLAEKLGLTAEAVAAEPAAFVSPRNSIEEMLVELWIEVLKVPEVGVQNGFLELGGDSVLAGQLVVRVQQRFEVNITLMDLLDRPTVEKQAVLVERLLLDEIDSMPEETA
jgi:acyl carrier protein